MLNTKPSFFRSRRNKPIKFTFHFKDGKPSLGLEVFNKKLLNCKAIIKVESRFLQKKESFIGNPKAPELLKAKELLNTHISNLSSSQAILCEFSYFYPFDCDMGDAFVETVFTLSVYTADGLKNYECRPLTQKKAFHNKVMDMATFHKYSQLEPKDTFSLLKNLKSITYFDKAVGYFWLYAAIFLVIVFMVVGIHDQFSSSENTWLLPRFDGGSRGGGLLFPIYIALGLSTMIFTLLFGFTKRRLRKYIIDIEIDWPKSIHKQSSLSPKDLIRGSIAFDLEELKIRVVSGNYLFYISGVGTSRPIKIHKALNETVLFEKHLKNLRTGTNLNDYFDSSELFEMAALFENTFPPVHFSRDYELSVHWEVQFIHPNLVDHEYISPKGNLMLADFALYNHSTGA